MISSRFAICAAAAAVALSLSACSTVDLDKDKAGSITDGTSVEEALSSKTGPVAPFSHSSMEQPKLLKSMVVPSLNVCLDGYKFIHEFPL